MHEQRGGESVRAREGGEGRAGDKEVRRTEAYKRKKQALVRWQVPVSVSAPPAGT